MLAKRASTARVTNPRLGIQNPPNSSRTMENKKALLKKALIAGGIGAIGAIVWHDLSFRDTVNIMNMSVPMPAVIGAACAGGSITADIVHMYLMPSKGPSNSMSAELYCVVVAGLGTIGFLKLAGADGDSFHWDAFALGAGAEFAANYLEKNFGSFLAFP